MGTLQTTVFWLALTIVLVAIIFPSVIATLGAVILWLLRVLLLGGIGIVLYYILFGGIK